MDLKQRALKLHEDNKGKIEISLKAAIENKDDLSLAYTPGVAEPCRVIAKDNEAVYKYTNRGNLVAVVTDGTAVLGLGDLGPLGAYPVMEGKAALFKAFANVDAVPICLDTTDVDEIVNTVVNMAPTFGGINLEDIASPRCFEIEKKLTEILDIPIFHDDQHGTAVVVLAALINALKVVNKKIEEVKVVINGIGAAGAAVANLILSAGVKHMTLVDYKGIVYPGDESNNASQENLAQKVNKDCQKGSLADALVNADVFIGVSRGNLVTAKMVEKMNNKAIIFAMANPVPEIYPDEAIKGGALVVGTGRSDFANQINNVLVFPGLFRGALDSKALKITEGMKLAAAKAIAEIITEKELSAEYIIPDAFDKRVANKVAKAVLEEAISTGNVRN
ncbi:NADP-dependent malic enzyme [Clostridium sp. 'deep sea']|uniref:NAD(P)-dependent malic enzyme n=1 Tax=Clostridium sp. 'deep sea' TaxID=2779445 RepID=UPI0018964D45|nr:NADP-dependent malic enzyme [Clostridium sp. 'deep sea']QOR33999.1 NADP-dependent malic enzyme [Clostridium sp. 'deep sea']